MNSLVVARDIYFAPQVLKSDHEICAAKLSYLLNITLLNAT